MALQDILQAIITETTMDIEKDEHAHRQLLKEIELKGEQEINREVSRVHEQRDQKKTEMKDRASSLAAMDRRLKVLAKKQEWMEKIYGDALALLSAMPKEKTESFLRRCIERIPEKGTLHPAACHADLLKQIAPKDQFSMGSPTKASGGFTCVTEKKIYNFTFDFLVREVLRPRTELSTIDKLF